MAKDKTRKADVPLLLDDDLGLPLDLPEFQKDMTDLARASNASPAQVEQWTRSFFENLATLQRVRAANEATTGELLHTIGTYVRELRGKRCWLVVGLPDWEAFCTERLQLSERHARRLAAFARAVTKAQAAYGVRKCLAGIALMRRLDVTEFSALVPEQGKDEPSAWAKILGEPLAFHGSTATRLERLLRGPKEPPKKRVRPTSKVVDVVEKRRAVIARTTERHPALDGLGVRSFARDGEARISHRPASTDAEIAALAALYVLLSRSA